MFATIYLPNFYLQAATRHQPELRAKPVGLIEEQQRKPVIVQLNEPAEKAGIRKGMTPSQALARSLRVVIKTRAQMQEKSIQEILIHHAFTLSPFVEATAPGICTVQFTDNRNLSEKVSRVIQQLPECEIAAQAAIAVLEQHNEAKRENDEQSEPKKPAQKRHAKTLAATNYGATAVGETPALLVYSQISREVQRYVVNAIVEFFQ